MVDRVQAHKWESSDQGGTDDDPLPSEIDPNEDGLDQRAAFLQNDTSADSDVYVSRDASDNMTFTDKVLGTKTLSDLFGDSDVPKVLIFQENPTANGALFLIGGYEQTDVDAALTSAAPVTASQPYFNARMFIEVTAATGGPFTIRVSGTSVDQETGALTPGDTEDIGFTTLGYYSTLKFWVTAPQVSIVEASKTATVTLGRGYSWNLDEKALTISAVEMLWTPDGVNWNVQLRVAREESDGSVTDIVNVTFDSSDTPPRAGDEQRGRFRVGGLSDVIDGSNGEGLFVYADQTRLSEITVGVYYG